jgi:hypothetical protein
MKIDQATLEAIVREVVQRILASHPELFAAASDDGGTADQLTTYEHATYEHYGRVLSEGDLNACRKTGKRTIRCDAKAIITPLARDRARDLGLRIVQR